MHPEPTTVLRQVRYQALKFTTSLPPKRLPVLRGREARQFLEHAAHAGVAAETEFGADG